jgi:hypothetical protein
MFNPAGLLHKSATSEDHDACYNGVPDRVERSPIGLPHGFERFDRRYELRGFTHGAYCVPRLHSVRAVNRSSVATALSAGPTRERQQELS